MLQRHDVPSVLKCYNVTASRCALCVKMLQCYSVTMCPLCANCSTWPLHQICDYTRVACKQSPHWHHDPHHKTTLYLSFALSCQNFSSSVFHTHLPPSVSKQVVVWSFMRHNAAQFCYKTLVYIHCTLRIFCLKNEYLVSRFCGSSLFSKNYWTPCIMIY